MMIAKVTVDTQDMQRYIVAMPSTLLLGRADIAKLLTVDDCLAAVEAAFRAHVAGQTLPPAILGVPATNGGFHVKAAGLVERQLPGLPRTEWAAGPPGVVALFDAAGWSATWRIPTSR